LGLDDVPSFVSHFKAGALIPPLFKGVWSRRV
jgi:hypothetical protein